MRWGVTSNANCRQAIFHLSWGKLKAWALIVIHWQRATDGCLAAEPNKPMRCCGPVHSVVRKKALCSDYAWRGWIHYRVRCVDRLPKVYNIHERSKSCCWTYGRDCAVKHAVIALCQLSMRGDAKNPKCKTVLTSRVCDRVPLLVGHGASCGVRQGINYGHSMSKVGESRPQSLFNPPTYIFSFLLPIINSALWC